MLSLEQWLWGALQQTPPHIHFQFQTSAQSDEAQNLHNGVVNFMPYIREKFGCDRELWWIFTYGMNSKGGMDEADFAAYTRNFIFPLYPNSRDMPGKRVLIMVDRGPG